MYPSQYEKENAARDVFDHSRNSAASYAGPRDVSPVDQSLTAQAELLDELDKAIQTLRQRLYVLMPEDAPVDAEMDGRPKPPYESSSRLRNAIRQHNERLKSMSDLVSATIRAIEV